MADYIIALRWRFQSHSGVILVSIGFEVSILSINCYKVWFDLPIMCAFNEEAVEIIYNNASLIWLLS
jgi:hypothetical protein